MATINSVLGEIDSKDLGFTLMHEHVMVAASGLSTHYPDCWAESGATGYRMLKTAKAHGIDTMLDATTFDLGRDPALLKNVAEASGMNLINVTGWWLDVLVLCTAWAPIKWPMNSSKISLRVRGTNIKAGMLKCAADFEGVTAPLETMARAVARAHLQTGVPIMVHSYPTGHVARRQIAIFKEEGVDLGKVKIDHSNDTTDTEYLQWILDQGCFLGLDRYPGRLVSPHMRTVTLKRLMDMGYGERLCPSHDCICLHVHNEQPDGSIAEQHDFHKSNPDQYLFMHRHVIPELQQLGATDRDIEMLFVDNPRRLFEA